MASVITGSKPRGGWVTVPFILGSAFGLSLAGSGWLANLVVYMIQEFHLRSIHATQVANLIYGFSNLIPIVGAVLVDSFLGSYYVILVSSFCSFLGMVILTLIAILPSLRPPKCNLEPLLCKPPSNGQSTTLYIGSVLGCIGLGGSRFTIATMGADQFDHDMVKYQETLFNWYFFVLYSAAIIGITAIVYVEDSVSWVCGFGLCTVASFLGLVLFVAGTPFYVHAKRKQESPFRSLFQTLVAAIRNMTAPSSNKREDYFDGSIDGSIQPQHAILTKDLGFLNKAALKITNQGLTHPSSAPSPWRLRTVHQVEELKRLIRIFPIWSSGILLCTSIAINNNLTILQALAMDRTIRTRFTIPAGSMIVFMLASTSASLTIIDRIFYPSYKKHVGKYPSLLQRVGVGHAVNISGMILSALIESRRLNLHKRDQQMSVMWVAPQLIVVGLGEAFHYAGQVAFYYKEFPSSLASTSTAMQAVVVGISYYLSSFITGVVRRVTKWLPDDVNRGRLDNVYWMLSVISGVNFVYYVISTFMYKSCKQERSDKNVGDGQTDCIQL